MAGSTPVDPNQLLKALATLLSQDGGIKGVQEVSKLLILMKSARKMVSRCIYINILNSTKDREIQEKFIAGGGWELLNSWLHEAKDCSHEPIIIELIKVFKELPVTIDILKKNNTAKTIKSLSKAEGDNDELKSLADALVTTWMGVIRTANTDKEKDAKEKSPSVKKKKKLKKVKSATGNDGDADDESDEPVSKKLRLGSIDGGEPMDTSEAHGASHPGDSPKGKHGNAKFDRITRHSTLKSATALRKSSSEDATKQGVEGKKEETKTKRTAKISRPAHTKFRSTGLEKDANLPPPKMKKKVPVHSLPSVHEKRVPPLTIKKDGPLFSKSLSPIDKKPKHHAEDHPERKAKLQSEEDRKLKLHLEEHAKHGTAGSTGHGKIKVIPAKHKLQESSGFLDALNAPGPALKKKIPKKVVRTNSIGSIKTKSPTPPEEVKVEPPKFSFYSSNQEEQKKEETVAEPGASTTEGAAKEEGDMGEDWNEERPITVGKSNLKFGPSRNKKQVRWKEETDLVDVYYFELDETERVNVNKVKDFHDAMANEKLMEKQAVLNAMKHGTSPEDSNGNMTVYFQWYKPHLLEPLPVLVDYGAQSNEKEVQTKREQTVLREIIFDGMTLPPTPKEPDPESKRSEQPKVIPLEDEASGDHVGPEGQFPDHFDQFDQFPLHGHEEMAHHGTPPHGAPHTDPHGVPHGAPHGSHQGGHHGSPRHGGHHIGPHGPHHGPPHGPPHGGPPHIHGSHQGGHHGAPHSGPPVAPPGAPRNGPHGTQIPQQQKQGTGPQGNTPPSPNTTIKNVQNLLASLSEGEAKPGSDLLKKENLDKLKEMLEPFKNQAPDGHPPPVDGNRPGFPPGPGNFGPGPGHFGPRGPPPREQDGPFPMGPGGPMGQRPMGPGPRPLFDGPGMEGGFGPRRGFGPGPNFPGPGRGMGPRPRGGRGGFPDMGRGGFQDMGRGGFADRGMGPRGPWRGNRGGPGGGRGRGTVVCYHWNTERGCLRGDKCNFLHPPKTNAPPT